MGKAVVSTTVGAEGLPVTGGEHVMLADEPRTFAEAIITLLRRVDRRRQLEAAARALVVERYDWSAVAGRFETVLVQIAARTFRCAPSTRVTEPHSAAGQARGDLRIRAGSPLSRI